MGARGRKSAAELSVIKSGDVVSIERPEPPSELTVEQAKLWVEIVGRMPADWFPKETHQLLVQYCRHVVRSRHISIVLDMLDGLIAGERKIDINNYRKLATTEKDESQIIASLATKMRMTQQSFYDQTRKRGSQVKKPWQVEG